MSTLRTDYQEDVFSGNRKYTDIENADGTHSYVDVTSYTTLGDDFGAEELNAMAREINNSFKKDEDISLIGLGSAATKEAATAVTATGAGLPTAQAVYTFTQSQISNMIANYLTSQQIAANYAPIASPTFTGTPTVAAGTDYGTYRLRPIAFGTTAKTAGVDAMPSGAIYLQYELA